jgi:hypothetical protein
MFYLFLLLEVLYYRYLDSGTTSYIEAWPDPLGFTGAALGCLGFPRCSVADGLTAPPNDQTTHLCSAPSA